MINVPPQEEEKDKQNIRQKPKPPPIKVNHDSGSYAG